MPKTLVSLLSHQILPDALMIREADFSDTDEFLFLTSAETEELKMLEHLLNATGIPEEKCRKVLIREDDLTDIRTKLEGLDLDKLNTEYWVNLTCGTKVMGLGVYDFFSQSEFDSHIFYVSFKKNWRKIHPKPDTEARPIHFRIGVEDYLKVSGIQTVRAEFGNQFFRPLDYARQLYNLTLNRTDKLSSIDKPFSQINWLFRKYKNFKTTDTTRRDWMNPFLMEIEFEPAIENELSKAEIQYLCGGWLEELLYSEIKTQLNLPSEAIRRNVVIHRENSLGESVPNEFDVLYTLNNALYVVECKMGLGSPREMKYNFNNTIYKLTALKTEFGLDVHGIFVTLADIRDSNGKKMEKYVNRANVHRIQIFDADDLEKGIDWSLSKKTPKMSDLDHL